METMKLEIREPSGEITFIEKAYVKNIAGIKRTTHNALKKTERFAVIEWERNTAYVIKRQMKSIKRIV
jgi:hypothetical protein